MIRFHLFVAIAGCLATPLMAAEPIWFTDQVDAAFVSLLETDLELSSDAFVTDRRQAAVAEHAHYAAFPLEEEPDPFHDDENNGNVTKATENGRSFRPVCDCGCDVPCLDHWCACDMAYCHDAHCNGHPCEGAHGTCRLTGEGQWLSNDACCDIWGPPADRWNDAVRFGWWAVGTDGSKNKIGEFQELESSPFWDIQTISSDGKRTWDVVISGLDTEANDAHVRYYSPGLSGKLDVQRYFRRLDHDPLMGLDLAPGEIPPPDPEGNVIVDDLNIGEDYAIRVQELEAKFQGRVMDHVKWRLNFWSQRKFGERQANASAHCFNVNAPAPAGATGNVCHVLSQRQEIDWVTVDVQPVIEAKFEDVTVEYSHTLRSFGQDDEAIFRQYTRTPFSPANAALGEPFQYALVPENMTHIDRLKIKTQLTEENQLYANLYVGDTKNEFREMHRDFGGYDVRLINTSFDDTTLTGYVKGDQEDTEFPPFLLDGAPLAPTGFEVDRLREPVDYTRTRAGIKGSWQPFGDRGARRSNYGLWDGTSLASGYEYYVLERDNATYPTRPGTPFTQPDTISNQIEFGPSTRWSRSLDTFVRYKVRFIEDPLLGLRPNSADLNTNQPEQVHATEIGGTWAPMYNFAATSQFSFVNSWHDSEFADFSEDSYPMIFTVWYAPTHRLSLTGGYAYFSNWIDQDITLGVDPVLSETTRWNYQGTNHLFNINANYAWTENVQLLAGFEWNRGVNTFDVPPSPAGADWSLLPSLSDVVVETQRFTTGVDWQPYCDTNLYLRYIFYDYEDLSSGLYSGTAHMALLGGTRTW